MESLAAPRRTFDIAIIGGGVNGCGIARDAAGRGWSVYLCEKDDLASSTSSASSKLIHGGLRYLEHFKFRLVREALIEREVLWRIAPHIVWPLRFVLPHHADLRPAWLLRIGLFLYDHLGGRRLLPPTRTLRLADDPAGEPLKPQYTLGFEYSDCWVEDARLVVLNARDAADKGAVIAPRTRCISGDRDGGLWTLTLRDERSGQINKIRARALVNAAGPWVGEVLRSALQTPAPPPSGSSSTPNWFCLTSRWRISTINCVRNCEELPRIFAQTGAVLVYATTEPTEALLLGGTTVTLHEGRVSQVGPTARVYRRPENIEAARVLSDPPLNELVIEKRGPLVMLESGRNLPVVGALSRLPDGVYRLGFRADAVAISDGQSPGLNFPGQVRVTELGGSESFVHVDVGIHVWGCLAPGVHEWQPGAHVEARVDANRVFVFDAFGRLATTPFIAKTA